MEQHSNSSFLQGSNTGCLNFTPSSSATNSASSGGKFSAAERGIKEVSTFKIVSSTFPSKKLRGLESYSNFYFIYLYWMDDGWVGGLIDPSIPGITPPSSD